MENQSILDGSGKLLGICSDHAGFAMKQFIIDLLEQKGIHYKDFGCYSDESCDYPDYAHPMGLAIDEGQIEFGVAICGTGNGINMTLNKHQKVRAALCWNTDIVRYARLHNNANVLTLPGRVVADDEARHMLSVFLTTAFEGGRHQRRIDKIPLK